MLRAIDMHVHVYTGQKAGRGHSPDEMAGMYDQLNIMAVIFDVDNETTSGLKISNSETAAWVRKYPHTFIGFGSVDPWKGEQAIEEIRRCAEMGLKGMKFQPITQAFLPNDERFFPIYEVCERLGLPVLIHSGTTAIGAGKPGGGGLRLEYGRPILVDEIAARYPQLRIILAHPAWPWHDEQLAIVRHKDNVYMDLSGWAPKYFPASVIQYANTLVQDKVFFGSDYPILSPQRWLEEFSELPFKDSVRNKILLSNASRFLGIVEEQHSSM